MSPKRFSRLLATTAVTVLATACTRESVPRATDGVDQVSGSGASTTEPAPRSVPPWISTAAGPSLDDHVVERARLLAGAPYQSPERTANRAVSGLTYGQYRAIRFRSDRAIWRGVAPFEVQLFHPGGGNDVPVRVHVVEDGKARAIDFDPELFEYGDEVDGADLSLDPGAGFAGLRVLHPLNAPDHMDEVVSFLGASYFRLLGPGHVYGLSSRGIAVDVARPEGEEFPDFVAFWLVRPQPDAATLTFHGLLDGPSVTGAYRFELTPGRDGPTGSTPTELAVEARLFARTDVGKLGVAPLTSMYLHGTFARGGEDDFRPRVHDSEGLLMNTGRGEWIWRPLTNGDGLRLTSLRDVSPAGFGLVQRDRSFGSYMDLEAQYHRRPSEWVVPEGDWGRGGVELLEIPTVSEFNDNIVASWVPDAPFRAGEARSYRYRLVTFDDRLDAEATSAGLVPQTLAQVVRTRIGWDALPGETDPPPRSQRRVVVDFEGGALDALGPGDEVTVEAGTSAGHLSELLVQPLPDGGRRVTFSLAPERDRGADMRVLLRVDGEPVSETWSYLWEPAP